MKHRFLKGVLLGVIASLLLGVLLPVTIYSTNIDQFTIGFWSGLSHYATWLLTIVFVTAVLLSILPARFSEFLASLLIAILFLLYIQGFYLVWNYGLLDGNDIDWWQLGAHVWIDIGVWGITLFCSIFYWRKISHYFYSISLLLLFLISGNLFIAYPKISGSLISTVKLNDVQSIFELSPRRNVIQIVLDAFESPAFDYIIKNDPNYQEMFHDFIYYRDTLASFPTTAASIPAILTGQAYDNSVPIKEFLADVLPEKSLPSFLYKNGSQVSLVTLSHYCQYLKSTTCLPLDQVNQRDFAKIEEIQYARLLDLSLFRALPHPLKPLIYNDQLWLLERMLHKRKGPPSHINSIEFVDLFERQVSVGRSESVYTLIHLLIPHTPLALDRECNYTKKFSRLTPQNLAEQSRCALFLADKILDRIKALGLWEETMIVISADHGVRVNFGHYKKVKGIPDIAKGLPILLIKPFGERGPMTRSELPAMLIDLPNTIATKLGVSHDFPGISLLDSSDQLSRERVFHSYSWKHEFWEKDYLPPMTQFIVQGDSWNVNSWKKGRELPTGRLDKNEDAHQ